MPIRNGTRPGDWLYTCQRCGFTKYASQIRQEWTGLHVCETCWEPRHPQEFVRGVADDMTVPFANPPSDPVFLDPNEVSHDDRQVLSPDGSSVFASDGQAVFAES